MDYRQDIQVLRGLSVIMVIIYHLQLGFLDNGFLGVDVFFVISGFLMAVLYHNKHHNKTSNTQSGSSPQHSAVVNFWLRRASRILPVYFFVIFFTLLFSYFWILPSEFGELTKHSLYATFLIPNIGYWFEASYFDTGNFRPLLHLWSLGIELQFYLIVPIIVALFYHSKKAVVILTCLTMLLCISLSGRLENSSFYLLPYRLWEFLLGFLTAKYFCRQGASINPNSAVGLIALLGMIVLGFFTISDDLHHPGLSALLIGLLTCAILAKGLPDFLLNNFIGRSFELTGRYSYSAYLVHYPIILFFIYQPFTGIDYRLEINTQLLFLVCLITICTVLCYHLIESPLRKSITSLKHLLIWLAVAIIVLVTTAIGLEKLQRQEFTQEQLSIFDSTQLKTDFRCGALFNSTHPFSNSCALTENHKHANRHYLLVGNSHADSIKTELALAASAANNSLRIWKDNFHLGAGKTTPESVIKEALEHNVSGIILHSSPTSFDPEVIQQLVSQSQDQGISIIYIEPIPTWGTSIPKLVWDENYNNAKPSTKTVGQHHFQISDELHAGYLIEGNNYYLYKTSRYFCLAYCPKVNEDGIPLYYDGHHLNLLGAQRLRPLFDQIFKDNY